jgi:sensor histidine kinase YesM
MKQESNVELEEKRRELEQQQKEAEVNYHRISGALALINQLIEEQKTTKK